MCCLVMLDGYLCLIGDVKGIREERSCIWELHSWLYQVERGFAASLTMRSDWKLLHV
jgi:hypothetical protein